MAGDPRFELGLPDSESVSLKNKQYFMDHLGLFCSGITPPLDHTGLLKDMMLQEVVRKKSGNWSTPLDVATPYYVVGSVTRDNIQDITLVTTFLYFPDKRCDIWLETLLLTITGRN